MKEDFVTNANNIVLKLQIDALKSLLTHEQKTAFNELLSNSQSSIMSKYDDNQFLSKVDFNSLFEKALIEL